MAVNVFSRTLVMSLRRCLSTTPAIGGSKMPDPYDHATGPEKQELMAKRAGDMDPFLMAKLKHSAGTKDEPTEVLSRYKARIVGCQCNPDHNTIRYLWVLAGEPRRCHCGHWYKLVEKGPLPVVTYVD